MMKSENKITGRLQTDDSVTVLSRSVRVSDYRESVRVSADGELVKVEVGYLESGRFTTPYQALSVDPAQARHLAGLLMKVAAEVEGIDFDPEDLAKLWRSWSEAQMTATPQVAAQLRLECLRLVVGARLGDYVNLAHEFFEFVTGSKVEAPPTATQAAPDQLDAR